MCVDKVAKEAFCMPDAFPCPVTCKEGQKMCTIVNYNAEGESIGYRDTCVKESATCPCGDKAKMCSLAGVSMCVSTKEAKEVCPCKEGQDVCYVENYDKKGGVAGIEAKCVSKGSTCPCGANALKCIDPQDSSKQTCQPKFSKDSSACPQKCTSKDEASGKATCIKKNVDSKGNPTGESVTCVAKDKCTPGKGQKKCPASMGGATIANGVACKDLYGLAAKAANATTRRLAQAATVSTKEKSQITFVLTSLKGTATQVPKVKIQVDSILQLTSTLQSELKMAVTGTGNTQEATMIFAVSNLGSSTVSPALVSGKLRDLLNAKDPATTAAFAPLGTVKLGPKGCCSIATDVTKVVEKEAPTTTTTPRPTTTTTTTKKPTTTMKVTTMKATTTMMVTTTKKATAAEVTTTTPKPKAKKITGKVTMDVTLPEGVTAEAFVKDAKVKAGVQKGIAASLGLTKAEEAWVVVTLSVGSGRRLADAAATGIVADYVITVPAANVGSTAANNLETKVKETVTEAHKTSMAREIMNKVVEEKNDGKTYTVKVKSMPNAIITVDSGTTPGNDIQTSDASKFAGLLVVFTALVHLAF